MKVTITISDNADGESISTQLDFDPPIETDAKHTPASITAVKFLEWIGENMQEGKEAK